MNSIYDAENLQNGFVPVVYGYYDRANMMESTPEVINHSHSLCEIMYVNEGTMSIETESNGFNQVSCNQFILIDAGIRHWDLRFNKGLCSMMNIEFQYEEGTGLAPDLASLLKADGKMREMFEQQPRVLTLSDRNGVIYQLMKSIVPLADSANEQSRHLCSLLCTQVVLETARLRSLNQSRESVANHLYFRGVGYPEQQLRGAADGILGGGGTAYPSVLPAPAVPRVYQPDHEGSPAADPNPARPGNAD